MNIIFRIVVLLLAFVSSSFRNAAAASDDDIVINCSSLGAIASVSPPRLAIETCDPAVNVLKRRPSYPVEMMADIYSIRGSAFMRLEMYDRAKLDIVQAREIDPQSYYESKLGHIYFVQRDFKQASRSFLVAARMSKSLDDYRNYRVAAARANEIEAHVDGLRTDKFDERLNALWLGGMNLDDLVKEAQADPFRLNEKLCDAYFIFGQRNLIEKRTDAARRSLALAILNCDLSSFQSQASKADLKDLVSR